MSTLTIDLREWMQKKEDRPTFSDICHDLRKLTQHYKLCGPNAKEPRGSVMGEPRKKGFFG